MRWINVDEHPLIAILLIGLVLAVLGGISIYALAWGYEFLVNVLPWPSHPFGIVHVQEK